MTDREKQILEKLADAWNLFLGLPNEHNDDLIEFRHHIHILQRQVMSRPTRRTMKDIQ